MPNPDMKCCLNGVQLPEDQILSKLVSIKKKLKQNLT